MEKWLEIKGYEGYFVSNTGRIKSKRKELKQFEMFNGYLMCNTKVKGAQTNFKIHRVVAEHFIPNPENKPCVNHKDTNKRNNHHSNLEWVTHAENNQHMYDNGLRNDNKKVIQYDKQGNELAVYNSMGEASRKTDTHISNISRVCKGDRKTANGFVWKLV